MSGPALAAVVLAGIAIGSVTQFRWTDAGALTLLAVSSCLLASTWSGRGSADRLRQPLAALVASAVPRSRAAARLAEPEAGHDDSSHRDSSHRVQPRNATLLLALFFAAFSHGALERDRTIRAPLRVWMQGAAPDGGAVGPVPVEGVLASDAAVVEGGVRVLLDLDWLEIDGSRRYLPGRVQVHVAGTLAPQHAREWTRGRRIAAPVLLREPQLWRNPGSPSEHWQRLRRPFDLAGTIKSAALVHVESGRWSDEAAAAVRWFVRDAAGRHIAPRSGQAAAITTAILIGDRAGLDDSVERRLQAAGTYHVIAISGGNIAILTVLTLFLLRLVVRPFRCAVLATISVVVTYGWVVGGEPSVRRAVTAASVYLALTLFGLAPNALNVLAVVALVLATSDPGLVLDAGAWLSFGATLGIILGASRFRCWATSAAPERPPHTRGAAGAARRVWLALLALFSATVAAELVLLPVSAALFFRAGLLGLVLNFVAIPAMTVVQIVGLAVVGFAGWWPAGADLSGRLAAMAAAWLVDSSLAVDAAPWMVWRVPPSSSFWILAFYVSLAAALWLQGRPLCRRLAGASAAALLIVIVTSPGLELAGPDAGRLRVTMLDVGQGEAIAVQFPDGHSMLVDAGGRPGAFEVGERVVTPALWALGVRRLDWLAVTHADADHVGGALEVVRNFQPREIWEGVPVPGHPAALALREEAHRRRSGWREVLLGQRLELGGAFIEALHPPRPDWERRRMRNEDSLVLRIVFGQVEILLTGDAGAEFERGYDPADPRAQLRVLKMGHHGSRTSSSAAFVEAVSPHIALVSAGHGNVFGHPAPDVLSRFEQRGTVVFRTDRDGAIIMETDGAAVDVRTWSRRRWSIRALQN